MRALVTPITVRIEGRAVIIREVYDHLSNAFDTASGRRLAVLATDGGAWWRGVRVDGPSPAEPRRLYCPGGVEEATRRLLTS